MLSVAPCLWLSVPCLHVSSRVSLATAASRACQRSYMTAGHSLERVLWLAAAGPFLAAPNLRPLAASVASCTLSAAAPPCLLTCAAHADSSGNWQFQFTEDPAQTNTHHSASGNWQPVHQARDWIGSLLSTFLQTLVGHARTVFDNHAHMWLLPVWERCDDQEPQQQPHT